MTMPSHSTNVKVIKSLLATNDTVAASNRATLDAHDVLTINLIAAPGAGKTSLISQLVRTMDERIGVIESDIAGNIDTATGTPTPDGDAVYLPVVVKN